MFCLCVCVGINNHLLYNLHFKKRLYDYALCKFALYMSLPKEKPPPLLLEYCIAGTTHTFYHCLSKIPSSGVNTTDYKERFCVEIDYLDGKTHF